jgi:hypothetical protein
LSLCLINSALRHEGVLGSRYIDPNFLELGTGWKIVVSFTPRPFYPQGRSPGTHWIGGWVGFRDGLDDVEKRRFLTLPGIKLRPLGRPARIQSLYTLYIVLIPPINALRLGPDILLSILFSNFINPFCSFKVNTMCV